MPTICKPMVADRKPASNFIADSGMRDYCVCSAKNIEVDEASMKSVFKFLRAVVPGLSITRAVRCAGYVSLIGTEGGMWEHGYVVRPIDFGARGCTRDMQDVCAALGLSEGLDYVDLVTVDRVGGVAAYHNVYRAA